MANTAKLTGIIENDLDISLKGFLFKNKNGYYCTLEDVKGKTLFCSEHTYKFNSIVKYLLSGIMKEEIKFRMLKINNLKVKDTDSLYFYNKKYYNDFDKKEILLINEFDALKAGDIIFVDNFIYFKVKSFEINEGTLSVKYNKIKIKND